MYLTMSTASTMPTKNPTVRNTVQTSVWCASLFSLPVSSGTFTVLPSYSQFTVIVMLSWSPFCNWRCATANDFIPLANTIPWSS